MTEREILERDIKSLRDLLRIAWRDLATKSYTSFERRELRNEMSLRAGELRQLLKNLETGLNRERQEAAARYAKRNARAVQLRLLSNAER